MDHYTILGLARGCTEAQVKKAYHILALRHHPDKVGSDGEEATKAINNAYETILATVKMEQLDKGTGKRRKYQEKQQEKHEDKQGKTKGTGRFESSFFNYQQSYPEPNISELLKPVKNPGTKFSSVTEMKAGHLTQVVHIHNLAEELNPLIEYYRKLGTWIDMYRCTKHRNQDSEGFILEQEMLKRLSQLADRLYELLLHTKGRKIGLEWVNCLELPVDYQVHSDLGKILNMIRQLLIIDEVKIDEAKFTLADVLDLDNMLQESGWIEERSWKIASYKFINEGWTKQHRASEGTSWKTYTKFM